RRLAHGAPLAAPWETIPRSAIQAAASPTAHGRSASAGDAVHRLGEGKVELAEPAGRVRRQGDVDAVPDGVPLRMMLHVLGDQRRARHESERLVEVLERERPLDRVATLNQPPRRQAPAQVVARYRI